jgi:arabinofuranan 3-O-arabinosyltransferase
MSVLLLPWAALPWLLGLTIRATRTGGWRAPAAFGLVLLAAGGVNASSLVLVALAPLVWLVVDGARDPGGARRTVAATARLGLVALAVSAWWLVGLRVQGAYGLPVLQLTEDVRTVATASTPGDVLRGLGNWFFYGRDRVGYSIAQADDYAGRDLVVLLSLAVPAAALAAGLLVRWAHRGLCTLLVVVGTVVAVGAWPYDDPSPYGAAWTSFTEDTSVGLALRNTPRAVPVVVLGMSGLLAAAVGAIGDRHRRWGAAGAVSLLAVGGLLPVWEEGFLSDGVERPEELPEHWIEATDALDAGDHDTRVLAVPGSSFAAYRWGTTVDPITPGLIDRPFLAREVLPSGTPPSVNLLTALDRRMQLGTFEPSSLPAVARLLGVGTVALRADLEQSGRFDTAPPGPLWRALRSDEAGLARPERFGPPVAEVDGEAVPAVALFDVEGPRPIVRSAPVERPVLLAGDGDGIVDAAAAGLLDGTSLVLPATPLRDDALEAALEHGAHLIVTDTHRRRSETWFYALRDDRGPTERSGATEPDPTGYDFRLDPYPGSSDDSRTVADHVGGIVVATGGGGPERPEHRAVHAFDGDPTTDWRIVGEDPRGRSITVTPTSAVTAGQVVLLQPPPAPGVGSVTKVRIDVAGAPPVDADLGPASWTGAGQAVALPVDRVERLQVTVLETAPAWAGPGAAPVGFSEITVGALRVDEVIRPPIDLLERVGPALDGHGLDIVLTRLRLDLPGTDRRDEEVHLDRWVDLPVARSFSVSGSVDAAAPAATGAVAGGCRSDLLEVDGRPVPVRLDGTRLSSCEPLALAAGRHRLVTVASGGDLPVVDRLVLSSGPDGAAASVSPRGAPAHRSGADVAVRSDSGTELALEVRTDGEPFWLVLGQSSSRGWSVSAEGARVGERQLVDGYANGWLVTPDAAGTLAVGLDWGPQRTVRWGWAVSAVAVLACTVVVWRGRRRAVDTRPAVASAGRPAWAGWSAEGGPVRLDRAVAAVAVVVSGSLLVATPAVAAASGALVAVASRTSRWHLVLAAAAPVALGVSRAAHRPSFAWLAVAALVAGLVLRARELDQPGAGRPSMRSSAADGT